MLINNGLDHAAMRRLAPGQRDDRRRWQAAHPHDVWHADVMHGPALQVDGRSVPLRIHAILDDRTRYIVAIQACTTERESEMLALMVKALRLHPSPKSLYLDNGATYIGETLQTACARLGIALTHARPYDPQSRGKMERFWRTLRGQCIEHMGPMASLHDVQVRILAWLQRHYLVAPHAGLLGRSPQQVLADTRGSLERGVVDDALLREALTVRQNRTLRGDGTLDVAGVTFELVESFLAGKKVEVGRSLLDPTDAPWVEHDGQRLVLRRVDPVANSRGKRARRAKRGIDAVPFDPPGAMLRALTNPKGDDR